MCEEAVLPERRIAPLICSPGRNRTYILGSGNPHTIHCTTEPNQATKVVCMELFTLYKFSHTVTLYLTFFHTLTSEVL